MSSPRRMRIAGVSIATGYVLVGCFGDLELHTPSALLFFGLSAALTLAVALLAAPLLQPPPPPEDPGDAPRDEPEPPWWPEFERDLRAYDARHRTHA
jgi:hypothetical protein